VLDGDSGNWAAWGSLAPQNKEKVGGSETPTIIIYDDKCEGMGLIFSKQP
jgi:hypothetical protein